MSCPLGVLIYSLMCFSPGGRDNRNHSGYSIIRLTPQKTHKTHLVAFSSDAIESTVGLTQGGLILVALMSGGDYDTSGVRSCGIRYACGLAKCGFGDELVDTARVMDAQTLTLFIDSLPERIREELITNSSGHLPSKRPPIARDTSFATFPNRAILDYYVNPATSRTHPETRRQIDWDSAINIGQVAKLCQEKFRWSSGTLVSKFQKFLLRGIAVRVLHQATMWINGEPSTRTPHIYKYLDSYYLLARRSEKVVRPSSIAPPPRWVGRE